MLTKKQHQLLTFIDSHLRNEGVSPSFEEMKNALNLKSKSGIHRLISNLEERGFIRRLPHRARALEILKQPADTLTSSDSMVKSNTQCVEPVAPENESVTLPLYGKIAAGTPVEALRDPSNSVTIPATMISSSGDHYSLEVEGESMIEDGICDGDTVIIERCDTAFSGTIVVALVDQNEVTLKRFRRNADSIALEPANKNHETRIFGPDRVKIQGKLVGLIRKY